MQLKEFLDQYFLKEQIKHFLSNYNLKVTGKKGRTPNRQRTGQSKTLAHCRLDQAPDEREYQSRIDYRSVQRGQDEQKQ